MKAVRHAIVAGLLIAVSVALAHLHVVSQTYHPVVQLASPDGLVYTAVQDSKHERQECGAANDRFLAPVKQQCKDCRVVLARCERELGVICQRRRLARLLAGASGGRVDDNSPEPEGRAQSLRQVLRRALARRRGAGGADLDLDDALVAGELQHARHGRA